MDIIDQIEIPSFEKKNAGFRRNFAIAAGCVGLLYALEQYNGSVSRSWKSIQRGITAAIAAWLEDHGGLPLFSLEGDDAAHMSHGALDINGLCGPRLTHEGGATTATAAAYLTQSHNPQDQQLLLGHRDAEIGPGIISALGSQQDLNDDGAAGAAAAQLFASADTPSFFQSTKFFACLDVEEARELFRATRRVSLSPHEVLFRSGDPSDSGIYIVLHGTLGVFLEDPTHNTPPIHANTLRSGESVGDLDVVDGAVRTVSCMALESGCLLVNVPRELFMDFVHSHPRALMLYLQQGLARLWRVAHFVLADFLQLQLYRPKPPGSALAAETAAAATVAASAAGYQPLRTPSNLFGQDQGTQTDALPPSPPTLPLADVGLQAMDEREQVEQVAGLAEAPPPALMEAAETSAAAAAAPLSIARVSEATVVQLEAAVAAAVTVQAAEALAGDCTGFTGSGGGGGGSGKKKSKRRKAQAAAQAAAAAVAIASANENSVPLGPPDAAATTVAHGQPQEAGQGQPQEAEQRQQQQQQRNSLEGELLLCGEDAVLTNAATGTAPVRQDSMLSPTAALSQAPARPYISPRVTAAGAATGSLGPIQSPSSAPTFNELFASAAASAQARGAGGPTHGPLRPEPPPAPSTLAAAAAAAALLANVPPPPPPLTPTGVCAAAGAAAQVPIPAAPFPVVTAGANNCSPVAASGLPGAASSAAAGATEMASDRFSSLSQPDARHDSGGAAAAVGARIGSGSAECSTRSISTSDSTSTIASSATLSTTLSSSTRQPLEAAAVPPPPLPPQPTLPSSWPSAAAAASAQGHRVGVGGHGLPGQRYGNGGLFGFTPPAKEEGSRPQGPVCRWYPGGSPHLRRSFVLGERACLAAGWDVIDVEELAFDGDMWATLSDPRSGVGTQLPLTTGGLLQDVDWASGCFYLLLDGHLLAERPAGPPGGPEDGPGAAGPAGLPVLGGLRAGSTKVQESTFIAPGSMISCAAFLSSTAARCKVVALEPARLVAFSWQTLESLVADSPTLLIRLLVAASAALGPVVRRFISLGLNRVWLESGDVAYRQGDFAECLYVVISGRLRLLHETMHPVTHARQLHLEEEVGRGEAVGAVWAITGGYHDTTALCVRDSELVRMSRSAFRVISADSPLALSKLFSNIARRLVAAWDSRVRSDRGASSSNAAATSSAAAAAAAAAGVGGGVGGAAATAANGAALRGAGLPQLPNPARLGLTPLKSVGQLSASSGVVRGPRPSGRRGEIVTIAILPAGVLPDAAAAATMSSALSGSPTDVAAAAAALAAGEAASMGSGGSGSGRAGSYSGLLNGGATAAGTAGNGGSWRWPPGLSKQAAALATLTAIKRLSGALKDALSPFGPVLLLDATVLSLQFPTASERLDVLFYRSKVTSWMAAQEEEYRFILLEGDVAASPWSSVCVAQADCILLVAPEGSTPSLSQPESILVFNSASPAFARPKPRRTGLTPALSTAPSSAQLAAAAAAPAAGATAAASTLRSPSRFANSSGGSIAGRERDGTAAAAAAARPPPSPVPSPPSRSSAANLNIGVLPPAAPAHLPAPVAAAAPPLPPPPAAAAAAGGVGGSQHPHHLYGAAQQLYGASSAAMLRRVELVLLHPGDGSTPSATAEWLAGRPNLSRHHHIRLGRRTDIQRLARWMAGKAVGIVLSGGGSRGLAHLGVLTALEDAGVPLDAVGGTSQGAFMAALYAQGLGREALNHSVRHYAQQLGSVRHLLSDITLPVLSLFSGTAFDQAVKRVFERGAQRLEDLWLPFFCVTTNLTRGEASVHMEGTLWKLVRASMTIVGLLPPVWEDGCLLVDGGYMNNMPVDVMRSMMGVDSVVVVDVEGRDDMGWRSLTPYDGGLSGWRLLWDRLCPIPGLRFAAASSGSGSGSGRGAPRYAALLSKLTSMTHVANLKRVAVEHRIDLYLRPPGLGGFRLMDFHLMDRIVKDAYRYATSAITQWKLSHRVGPFGIEDIPMQQQQQQPTAASAPLAVPGPVEVAAAVAGNGTGGGGAVSVAATAALSPAGAPVGGPAVVGPGAAAAAAAVGTPGGAGAAAGGAPVPSCMTQLQKKQQPAAAVLAAVTASVGGTVPSGGVSFVATPPALAPAPPLPVPASRRLTPPPRPALMLSCPPPASSPATSASISPVATAGALLPAAPPTAAATAGSGGAAQQRRYPADNAKPYTAIPAAAAAAATAAATTAAPTGVVRFADRVLVSTVESVPVSDDDELSSDDSKPSHRRPRWSGTGAMGRSGSAASSASGGGGGGADGQVVGSPPSPPPAPTLRPVMSRLSRSGTRHSLLDLQ